jgi:hypothetical protein
MNPAKCRLYFATTIFAIFLLDLPAVTPGQSVSQRPECGGVLHGVVLDRQGKPVPDIRLLAYPVGVHIEGVLARTRTNQAGEYRFEHLCPDKYTAFPDDEKAGYEFSSPWPFEFFSGRPAKQVKLDSKHPSGEISISLFPKPAQVEVFVATKASALGKGQYSIWLSVPNQLPVHRLDNECLLSPRPSEFKFRPNETLRWKSSLRVFTNGNGESIRKTKYVCKKEDNEDWTCSLSHRIS